MRAPDCDIVFRRVASSTTALMVFVAIFRTVRGSQAFEVVVALPHLALALFIAIVGLAIYLS